MNLTALHWGVYFSATPAIPQLPDYPERSLFAGLLGEPVVGGPSVAEGGVATPLRAPGW